MWHEIKLIMWKNLLTRKRHYFLTVIEILLPILLFILVAFGRSQINGLSKTVVKNPVFHEKITEESLYSVIPYEYFLLLYAPSSSFADDIIRQFQVRFDIPSEFVQEFWSKDDILAYYEKNYKDIGDKLIVSVVFKGNNTKHLDYDLSVYEEYLNWNTDKYYGPLFTTEDSHFNSVQYNDKSFVGVQMGLFRAFLDYSKKEPDKVNLTISLQQFPYPPHIEDQNLELFFNDLLPLITTLSFLFTAITILSPMMEEKQSGVQMLLKVHGMKTWMTFLGWIIDNLPLNLISISIIVILMKVRLWGVDYAPIECSSSFVLYTFLFLYYLGSLAYCFLLASLFTKPSVTVTILMLFWIFSYLISQFITNIMEPLDFEYKMLTGIFPNMALHHGFKTISIYEARGINVDFFNIKEETFGSSNDVTMYHVYLMLLGNILFPIIFIICAKNSIGNLIVLFVQYFKRKSFPRINNIEGGSLAKELETFIQSQQGIWKKHIEIRNLTKEYNGQRVVNELTLDIFKKQITVILGENGAGKTTTLSMIAGMLQPSSGKISLGSEDLSEPKIGFCPQHNRLFPSLTTKEHLIFFAMLKGKTFSEAKKESYKIMGMLNLRDKINSFPHQLSGGMKRKLCLGIAMAGGNEILILDEPTAGLDYESKYSLWNIFRKLKKKKTIIISTHFMEEAEILADQICILFEGKLQCYGTPSYLKDKYGSGYHLSFTLETADDRDKMKNDILNSKLAIKLVSTENESITYNLPTLTSYSKLFIDIEEITSKYNIKKTSLKSMTIDEVFAKAKINADGDLDSDSSQPDITFLNKNRKTPTLCDKMKALLWKRLHFYYRKLHIVLIKFFTALTISIVIYLLTTACVKYNFATSDPLTINLKNYGNSLVYFSNVNNWDGIAHRFNGVILQQNGLPKSVQNVSHEIIEKGAENIAFYKKNMIIAAEINEEQGNYNVNCLFSLDALHSPPISLNLAMNAITKKILGDDYLISLRNVPFKGRSTEFISSKISATNVTILWYLFIPIAFLLLISNFIIFPSYEIPNNFVYLQYMAGIRMWLYWSIHIMFHMILSTVQVLLILVVLIVFDFKLNYFGAQELGAICTIFFSCMPSILLSTCLFSFKKTSSVAYLILILLIMGLLPTFAVYMFESLENGALASWLKRIIITLCPPSSMNYLFLKFIRKFAENYNWKHLDSRNKEQYCKSAKNPCCNLDDHNFKCSAYMSYFENENYGIGSDLPFLLLSFVFFLTILSLSSSDWHVIKISMANFDHIFGKNKERNSASNRANVEAPNKLEVSNIRKTIGKRVVTQNVSFTIEAGKCVGLLGRNGEGKTTTMRMLSGELVPDKGDIFLYIKGQQLKSFKNSYCTKIGYCPQGDILNMAISGRELIKSFVWMKGYKDVDIVTTKILSLLDLKKYAERPCKHYSGGNKRKLNAAIALIGLPEIILLDEPTSGIDPVFRRKFWNIVKLMKMQKKGILLSSHSMEEYEALVDHAYILKDKIEMNTEDTLARLENGYFPGWIIKFVLKVPSHIKLQVSNAEYRERQDLMISDLKNITVLGQTTLVEDKYKCLICLFIENPKVKLSVLFATAASYLELYKDIIFSYTISDIRLEDVFIKISNKMCNNGKVEESQGSMCESSIPSDSCSSVWSDGKTLNAWRTREINIQEIF